MPLSLRLIREPSRHGATLGVLFSDGAYLCWTCEDEIREVSGRAVSEWKVAGQTAIPAGDYAIIVTFSQRFQQRMPLLVGVEGFEGVRIHPGNTAVDTHGCLLPGMARSEASVGGSRQAYDRIFPLIDMNPPVTIRIENPA